MKAELSQTTIMSHRLNGQVLEDKRLLIWHIQKDVLSSDSFMPVVCDV